MLVTFASISSSLLFQHGCRERAVPCTLISVPRRLSFSCGYAARVEQEKPEDLVKLLHELKVEWEGVYRPHGDAYEVLYRCQAPGDTGEV